MTRVVVQASRNAVQLLRRNELLSSETRELAKLLQAFGVELRPTHANTQDPDLSVWFEIDAPDFATAERIISRLQSNSAVEAAYIKPVEEPPRD
jgi:hypothetical protein